LVYWKYVDNQRRTQPIDETKGPIMEQVQRVCRPTLPWLA